MYEPTQESLPTENGYAAWLLRLIHDSQEPCVCPGFGGHTNRDCPWYDLPHRAHIAAKVAANDRRAHRSAMVPSAEYIADLERRHAAERDRTARYRLFAELEDIADAEMGTPHWSGPRTDDPPANWEG